MSTQDLTTLPTTPVQTTPSTTTGVNLTKFNTEGTSVEFTITAVSKYKDSQVLVFGKTDKGTFTFLTFLDRFPNGRLPAIGLNGLKAVGVFKEDTYNGNAVLRCLALSIDIDSMSHKAINVTYNATTAAENRRRVNLLDDEE